MEQKRYHTRSETLRTSFMDRPSTSTLSTGQQQPIRIISTSDYEDDEEEEELIVEQMKKVRKEDTTGRRNKQIRSIQWSKSKERPKSSYHSGHSAKNYSKRSAKAAKLVNNQKVYSRQSIAMNTSTIIADMYGKTRAMYSTSSLTTTTITKSITKTSSSSKTKTSSTNIDNEETNNTNNATTTNTDADANADAGTEETEKPPETEKAETAADDDSDKTEEDTDYDDN